MPSNLIPGLVSVTFRKLSPREIVDLCRECALSCIEWGGDIHVPHGDSAAAEHAAELTRSRGLHCAAYGSYYRCGVTPPEEFAGVLRCAEILNAPFIRVWAGAKASSLATPAERDAVAADLRRCARMAAGSGIKVSTEYHSGTLTDTPASCAALLADCPDLCTGWQPPVGMAMEECCQALRDVLPRLSTVHAFHWLQKERLPMADGITLWKQYLSILRPRPANTAVLLEFVRDDSPEQLRRDARSLLTLLASL